MDFMPEDFRDSDELWLAENVFSHLKEFDSIDRKREDCVPMECNNEATILKEINDPVLNCISNNKDNQLQYDLQSLSRDGENKENLNEPETVLVENIKKEIPELKFSCEEFILPKEQTLLDKGSNDVAPENSELVVIQDEDSKQYYQVFMSLPDGLKSDDVVIVNEEDDSFVEQKISVVPRSPFIKCMDCSQVFEEISFSYHVCDYDWTQTLISLDIINNKEPVPVSSFLHPSNKKLKEKLILEQKLKLPVDPPCIRQIRENLGRIRKFIKDELKIDLTSSSEKKLDGPHECTLCERKFVHASGLSRHMEKHAMDLIPSTNPHLSANSHQLKVMIKCLVCGRLFFKTKHALAHFSDDHQTESDDEINNIVTENENDEDVNKEVSEDLINALIEEENQKNFNADIKELKDKEYFDAIIVNDVLQCEFCEYIFSECSDLLLHSACHDPNRRFECCSCEIQVSTSKEIFLHWQAECVFARELVRENLNLKRYYTCNVCENKFLSMEQLFDHRYTALHFFPRLKLGTKILQVCCEYCGGVYDKIETLIKHREDKHLKKIIEKKNNSIALTGFGNVQNEIPTNQKLRQYLCDVCGKSYTQSSHLWQHLRFHRGVKPFSCKEPNCTRSFTIRPDLNDHIRKCHTGERPYQCQVCGKRFLTGSVYYQHRLIHRGDRRYACEECGKRFYRADALKNHLRIHTGEKPYGCLYCTKNFRQRGDRDKHIRARHSNLDENAKNVLTALKNGQMPPPPPPTKKNLFPSMPFISSTLAPEFGKKDESIVYVGNIPFASSIFNPILKDIDAMTD